MDVGVFESIDDLSKKAIGRLQRRERESWNIEIHGQYSIKPENIGYYLTPGSFGVFMGLSLPS